MRSEWETPSACEETDVKVICALEEADGEYKDCPVACRANESTDEPTVVKAGDLAVTARAADNKKIVLPGTSDLDTLTFKTSEEVEITKVVLERYGYSDASDIEGVRLEDEDGNVIADSKGLTKDKATLSIKKDYRKVDWTFRATIVVLTTWDKASGTIGFKVADVTSTAKNVDLGNYSANTYDIVTYSGANVAVDLKGTTKKYNYEEGKSYEVARFQVKSNGAAITVRGFTLSNNGTLDVEDFLDEVVVTADGKEVSWLKYNVNKDGQLVVSFNATDIEMNKRATFVVSESFKELDEYNKSIAYYLGDTTDFNATEKKTGARVTVTGSALTKAEAKEYTFNGWKIKLSNTKLAKVEASQSAEDVVVAEGNITVSEPISKVAFEIAANSTGVDALRIVVAGEEFEWKRSETQTWVLFSFSNVEITESGKVQFTADLADDDNLSWTIEFKPASFNKAAFSGARYDEAREEVLSGDVAGSIALSAINVTAAKATLKNSLTKDVEFLNGETNTKIVFDGTYTAKKAPVTLNSFYMKGANDITGATITFHLYIDGEEVADVDTFGASSGDAYTFSDVEVKAWESVKVKVEAEVEAYGSTWDAKDIQLYLGGVDEFGKDIQEAHAKIMNIKVKESGSVIVSAATSRNTVLRSASNAVIAEFTVKPANGDEGLTLDDIKFEFSTSWDNKAFTGGQLEVLIDDSEEEESAANSLIYKPVVDLPADWIVVKVSLIDEYTWSLELKVAQVNGKNQSRTFSKRYEEALVYITKQDPRGDETVFTLGVDADSDTSVKNVTLYAGNTLTGGIAAEFADWDEVRFVNESTAKYIDKITYQYKTADMDDWSELVEITKDPYNDYFKVGNDYAKVSKASD